MHLDAGARSRHASAGERPGAGASFSYSAADADAVPDASGSGSVISGRGQTLFLSGPDRVEPLAQGMRMPPVPTLHLFCMPKQYPAPPPMRIDTAKKYSAKLETSAG